MSSQALGQRKVLYATYDVDADIDIICFLKPISLKTLQFADVLKTGTLYDLPEHDEGVSQSKFIKASTESHWTQYGSFSKKSQR